MKNITVIMLLLAVAGFTGELSGPVSGYLSIESSPYIVRKDLLIQPGKSLTIDPGVILKFDSTVVFRVEGKLTAKGTTEQPVLFTSTKIEPVGAAWEGIQFTNRSDNASMLDNCTIRFARRGISIFSVSPQINRCTVSNCDMDGILIKVGQSIISSNKIKENGGDGIHASSFAGSIENNELTTNGGDGINLENSSGLVQDNVVTLNGDDGIFCKNSDIWIRENLIRQNTDDGILIDGASPQILNNVLARNRFGVFGYNMAAPILVNNTIVDNIFALYGRNQSAIKVDNSIVWRNETSAFSDSTSSVSITFSNVQGGFNGNGNFSTEPNFISMDNYQLKADSPCIGRGNPTPLVKDPAINSNNIGADLN